MVYQPHYDNPALEALASNMSANVGCYLIGCVLNLVLFAVVGMQALDYFKFFPNDSRINKAVVIFLCIGGTFQSGCFVEMIWSTFIDGFGDLAHWNYTKWTWWSEPIVSSIISVVCQAFFLNRCWRVTRSYITITVAIILMTAALAFGAASTYYLAQFILFTESNRIQSKICASAWLAFSTATDIWISSFLVVHLYKEQRRHSGFSTTDRILQSLLAYTLKTAALTSLWVTLNLILYAAVTQNFVWAIWQFNMGKIYSISVLYTLLSRIDVRKILQVHNVQVSSSRGRSNEPHAQSAIHIRTEVERDYELDSKALHSTNSVAPPIHREMSRQSDSEQDAELGLSQKSGLQDSFLEDDLSTRALRYNNNAPF